MQAESPQSGRTSPAPSVFCIWWTFFKIGAVLFGGGYAMLALLEREIVEKRKWLSREEMQNYFALAQLLPGVIAINAAMLAGGKLRGLKGNIAAAVGTVAVPFGCIALYAVAYDTARDLPAVQAAMAGMRPAVAGMIAGLGLSMVCKNAKTPPAVFVAVVTFAVAVAFDPPIVAVLAIAVAAGVLKALFTRRRGGCA